MKKKLLSLFLAVLMSLSLAVPGFAVGETEASLPDEEILLNAVQPVIRAHQEHYVVDNVRITEVHESAKTEDGTYVEFILTFDAMLKYDSATEIPRIQGIARSLNVESAQTVDQFIKNINSIQTVNQVETYAQEQLCSTSTLANAQKNLTDRSASYLIAESAVEKLEAYVLELEADYIGQSYEHNIGLRATIDNQGNLVELEYGTFDGYCKDISAVIPLSTERMIQDGNELVEELIDVTWKDAASQGLDTMSVSPSSNTGFTYYRTNARDYANRCTSNAAEVTCRNEDCDNYGGKIRQAIGFYSPNYKCYCCNDCANYVSQAMAAGGVPTDNQWKAESGAWISCPKLRSYFYTTKKYWSSATYQTCNAGGIILLHNSTKPFHAMMTVLNDGVTTQYSAHTNDRKMYQYTNASLLNSSGTTKVEYFIFDKVSPAH